MVYRIDDELVFPDPYYGDEDGLIAVGGDLSVERLLLAYSNGIFPWYAFEYHEDIMWYCPLKRFVIFPEEIHISHSMRTLINKERYRVSMNEAFDEVIGQCSSLRIDEVGAWLGNDMMAAYKRLHDSGYAASVEVWDGDNLVGGLYGVTLGWGFFGESMFSLVPDASKLALICLADFLKAQGRIIIDCQFETPHLKSMGGRFISYSEYMDIISGK
jgi:leucyl/phenylalanyl-tRNA--protein transferase